MTADTLKQGLFCYDRVLSGQTISPGKVGAVGFAIDFGLVWFTAAALFAQTTSLVLLGYAKNYLCIPAVCTALLFAATVRTIKSLCFGFTLHHSVHLVDNRSNPLFVEKWALGADNMTLRVELSWDSARTVKLVWMVHAGAFEHDAFTVANDKGRCFAAGQLSVQVCDNRQSMRVVRHHVLMQRGFAMNLRSTRAGDRIWSAFTSWE